MTQNDLIKIGIWAVTENTGISSECIAAVMLGAKPRCNYPPSDPSDFCRCLKLIRMVPAIREQLWRMNTISNRWMALIKNWDTVESQFLEEVGGWLDCEDTSKPATKTYRLMEKIYNGIA